MGHGEKSWAILLDLQAQAETVGRAVIGFSLKVDLDNVLSVLTRNSKAVVKLSNIVGSIN